eukprot:3579863-Pleurochrysis_carterae.AAC.1
MEATLAHAATRCARLTNTAQAAFWIVCAEMRAYVARYLASSLFGVLCVLGRNSGINSYVSFNQQRRAPTRNDAAHTQHETAVVDQPLKQASSVYDMHSKAANF